MTKKELREYVMKIMDYLRSDYEGYEKALEKGVHVGAGPYLLSASSGIDFLGSLAVPENELEDHEKRALGLEKKSTKGSKWYIRTYLGRINQHYLSINVNDFIYKILRCGQVHEGMVKRGALISFEIHEKYHLKKLLLKETNDSDAIIKAVSVNTRYFASDFIKSMELFKNDLNCDDDIANQMAARLSEHLNAVRDVYQGLDLPEEEVDPYELFTIYEISSSSPDYPKGQYHLKDFC